MASVERKTVEREVTRVVEVDEFVLYLDKREAAILSSLLGHIITKGSGYGNIFSGLYRVHSALRSNPHIPRIEGSALFTRLVQVNSDVKVDEDGHLVLGF